MCVSGTLRIPPSDSGFADEATQAAKLMKVFRHFNADKDGWVSLEEFQAALVRLNFVGVQREVHHKTSRYDPCVRAFTAFCRRCAADRFCRSRACLIATITTAAASCRTRR